MVFLCGLSEVFLSQCLVAFDRIDTNDPTEQGYNTDARLNVKGGPITDPNNESINDTYEILRSEFSLRRVRVANPRIARRLPFGLSRLVGVMLRSVKPAWVRNLYVLTK